ncbi:hypothetical protein F383_13363 [Gossypium arboreum]|uniref:Uncharacterized protein n=1 Tax=Gossypium arboreum TaxID=29729 RepID=A0A0B0N4Q0_GOSAR|nr:hypothetical protein F383_13363 [Gossypium arboreum]
MKLCLNEVNLKLIDQEKRKSDLDRGKQK